MRHYILSLLFVLLFCLPAQSYAQQRALKTWQVYLPQTDATSIAVSPDKVYVGTKYYLYEYNPSDASIRTLSGLNGFSELGIAQLAYNEQVNALIVAYNSANLDVWQNGKVRNYPDIKRSNVVGEKFIYHMLPYGNKVYIACSFGIVVLNLGSGEFEDTFVIGPNGSNIKVYQIAINGNQIVAATENGLYQANLSNPNLAFYTNWQLNTALAQEGSEVKQVVYTNNSYFAVNNDLVYQSENLIDWQVVYGNAGWCIKSLESSFNRVILCEWNNSCVANDASSGRVAALNPDGTIEVFDYYNIVRPIQAFATEEGNIWAADYFRSLLQIYSGNAETIIPEGPYSANVFRVSAINNDVWVANGGIIYSNWNALDRREGFGIYRNGQWESYGEHNTPTLTNKQDILDIVKHPTQNKYYIASYNAGLLEYDGSNFTQYNTENSSLQTTVGDEGRCRVSSLSYDSSGNLWIANFGAPNAISVYTAQGQWQSFTTQFIPGSPPNPFTQIIVDDYDQKWVVVHKNGLLVFNHGTDLQNTTDDSYKLLKSGSGLGGLPVNEVTCIAKDNDGAIWVGTTQGIGIYYCPYAVFESGCDAVRPYVEVNGFGAYLLETEVVRAIAVDGANRKWVGTENGLWLFSADGTEPLQYFTKSNSPLLSDFITSLSINGQSGEVFIGTDRGLVSYRSDATEAGYNHGTISIFPNPVRPEYEGDIAIRGLAENANLKITDVAGNLIFETTANGGTAIWNGKDYTGKKAATGVYLIFGSNADGTDNVVSKLMLIR